MLDMTGHQDTTMDTAADANAPIMEIRDLSLWYGEAQALEDVSFDLNAGEVLAFIGPSGCGKSTALKCLNRMHDDTRGVRLAGTIRMTGTDIHAPGVDAPLHRKRFGWVAQKPNPFPMSVYRNVAYGAHIHGLAPDGPEMDDWVEACLRRADLWDEVKDRLHAAEGLALSGGQQQRLCIARALSTDPEVLLMDEPTGSVDPIATEHIERLMVDLGRTHAVVVVTHSMMQARRVATRVAHFHLGRLMDIGPTDRVFDAPATDRTRDFIAGLIG